MRRKRVKKTPDYQIRANLLVFIASFCTLVIELVAGRILAPDVGVSLYTWTSIIGVVLAGISIGAFLGGRIADRFPRPSTLGWLLLLSGLSAFSISPLTNLAGDHPFHTTLMARIVLVTGLIFFAPSCLLGMISPVVVKLKLKDTKQTGSVVGRIYAFSTFGSIVGTFATGFFLISWLGTRNLLFSVGCILVIAAPVFGAGFMKKSTLALLFIVLVPLLWGLYDDGFKPVLDTQTLLFKESNYYTIRLIGDPKRESPLVTLYIDNLTHSCSDLNDPSHLVYRYLQVYEEVLRWQAARKPSFSALFIGGGGFTFPRFIEANYPGASISVVEIDPEIIRVSRRYLGIPAGTKIRTINEDGRWFVMTSGEKAKYDFIFLDAFNDLSIPYHLTTKEFAADLKRLLKPDGLILTNVIDNFAQGRFLPSYTRTLAEVFGRSNVRLITVDSKEELGTVSNFVVLAGLQKPDMNDFVRSAKARKEEAMTAHVLPEDELDRYLRERPSLILTDDYVPVDNLIAPNFEELYGYAGR